MTTESRPSITLPVVTYTPASDLRSPASLFAAMWRDIVACRELAWRLTVRDISAQYRQSLLGILWAFIPPVVSAFVFVLLQQSRVVNIADPGMPYALFVLIGTSLWQTFADAVNAPLKIAVASKPVLAKTNFAREALIVSAFYQTLFGFAIKAVLILLALTYFRVPLTWNSALALFPIGLLIWLGVVIGLVLTPLGLLLTDVASSLVLVLQLGFFLTPVVYPAPDRLPYSALANWNPVAVCLTAARDLLVLGSSPEIVPLLTLSGLVAVAMLAGWVVYRVAMPIIIERMSA